MKIGNKEPKIIEFNDKKYRIDRVLGKGPAACRTVGGVGVKYICVVLGEVTEL